MFINRITQIFITILFTLSIVSCDNLLNTESDRSPIDWEDGPGIADAEDSHLPDSTRANYKVSAEELALRAVINQDSTQIDIPENLIDTYYNGLIHIVNSGLQQAEDVTESYSIQARPEFKHGELLVFPDIASSSEWIDAWRNGETNTGNTVIDDLIEKHGLTLESYKESDTTDYGIATFTTDQLLNTIPVAMEFEALADISNAGPNGVVGDGSDIIATVRQTTVEYRYEYGWGDCPAGCSYRHYWVFRVDAEGDVSFEEEGGDPLP